MSERTRNVLDDVQSGSFSPNTENGPSLHPVTADLVSRFMGALAEKLAAAEAKYGYSDGWADPAWQEECRRQLHHHAAKGDPRDVAAYAAFCWHHGWSTSDPSQPRDEPLSLPSPDNTNPKAGAPEHG